MVRQQERAKRIQTRAIADKMFWQNVQVYYENLETYDTPIAYHARSIVHAIDQVIRRLDASGIED